MRYVDGFVIPVAKRNVRSYRVLSQQAGKIWREHGALAYVEAVGDDLAAKGTASFAKTHRLKRGETLFFSWIVYKSRAHRDRANARIMKDPRIVKMMTGPSPFDAKRMLYGGFKVLVDL